MVRPRSSRADLLDANESTWAFAAVDCISDGGLPQFIRLGVLATADRCRYYSGRAADDTGRLVGAGEREDAEPFEARLKSLSDRGTPHPLAGWNLGVPVGSLGGYDDAAH